MSNPITNRPPEDGNGLGPIGTAALKSSTRQRGIAPLPDPPATEGTEFDAEWAKFETFARQTFEEDLTRARAKAQEYGSHDLEIMGTSMAALLPGADLLDAQTRRAAGLEMAIAFYLLGKASRMFGAFKKGSPPGTDSWRDGSIYSLMGRYVRLNGRWIG